MIYNKLSWLYCSRNLKDEILQCRSEGKDVAPFLEEAENIRAMPEGDKKETAACAIMKKLEELPLLKDYPYYEPDDYSEIVATLYDGYREKYEYDAKSYHSRLNGAWIGRAVGCLLGIPVETWKREKIHDFLKDTGNYPLSMYMSSLIPIEIRKKYNIFDEDKAAPYDRQKVCWINNIKEFPVDDDTNYTVSSLRLVERFGVGFTSEDVAESWLFSFPALHSCTAERIAYKNFINCILPPHSAKHLNPFREWIGAQIRSDFYGYIAPGNPCLAASMAFRDSAVSHVKNGIYGAMYIAALTSIASCENSPLWMVQMAVRQIPPKSRLSRYVFELCEMYSSGKIYSELIEYIHSEFNEHEWFDWCHTIPNAMLVTANLLYFGRDFNSAITNTVMCGFDTDCNSATIGSIVGIICGIDGIDKKWLKPVEPALSTSIHGYHLLTIDYLVDRTYKLVCR